MEALGPSQRHSKALKGTQTHSEALRGNQRHSEALRGTQRHSEAIRPTQRQSEALPPDPSRGIAPCPPRPRRPRPPPLPPLPPLRHVPHSQHGTPAHTGRGGHNQWPSVAISVTISGHQWPSGEPSVARRGDDLAAQVEPAAADGRAAERRHFFKHRRRWTAEHKTPIRQALAVVPCGQ